jgi:hypothetical protein
VLARQARCAGSAHPTVERERRFAARWAFAGTAQTSGALARPSAYAGSVNRATKTTLNGKCLTAGVLACGFAITVALLFAEGLVSEREDANIGGGSLAFALMCGSVYFGVNGRREAGERGERGRRIAAASIALAALWIAIPLVLALVWSIRG